VDSDGSIARVEFYADGNLVGTATDAPYSVTWSNGAAGTYSTTAVAYDNLGASAVSPPVVVTIRALRLTLAEPANGASFSGDSVVVSGSIQAPPNTGVTVNGVVASMTDDHRFYAKVPLVAGANPITATLTTQSGRSATKSITVTSDGVPSPLRITADTLEGLAPLTTTFELVNGGTSDYTVQLNGSMLFTLSPGQPHWVSYNLSTPGSSVLRFTATDAQGNTSEQSFAIVANDPATVDQNLKALWAGMNDAVIAGNKEAALSYLSEPARGTYGPVFDVLQSDYAQIAASFSPLQGMGMSPEMIEYAVNRTIDGENRIFFIYFVRDLDGTWRLDSM